MKKSKKPKKPFFSGIVKCAFCGKENDVKAVKNIETPSVPAQTNIKIFVEKRDQKSMGEFK